MVLAKARGNPGVCATGPKYWSFFSRWAACTILAAMASMPKRLMGASACSASGRAARCAASCVRVKAWIPWQPFSEAVIASSFAAARVGARTTISRFRKRVRNSTARCSTIALDREQISERGATHNYMNPRGCESLLAQSCAGVDPRRGAGGKITRYQSDRGKEGTDDCVGGKVRGLHLEKKVLYQASG